MKDLNMFKKIPGNSEYVISLDGEVKKSNGAECTLPIANGKITINLYGYDRIVDLEWLALIAQYEVYLPAGLSKQLPDVNFVEANPRSTIAVGDKIMVFRRPIQVDKKFRVVPCYTRYAVSKDGEILDMSTGCMLLPTNLSRGYPTSFIYDPIKQTKRSIVVHRLVALAWVPNEDWWNNYIVNHLDGNKNNCKHSNLEWTDYIGNSRHAVATGLHASCQRCYVRDVVTGEINEHVTLLSACNQMGVKSRGRGYGVDYIRKNKLIAGRYELKLASEKTPWRYQVGATPDKAGRYIIDVTMPNGQKFVFNDTRDSKRELKLWNTPTIWEQKDKAKRLYPGIVFEVNDLYNATKPVEAYCLKTGAIVEHKTIKGLAALLDINWQVVRRTLLLGETAVAQGYAFRRKKLEPWDKNFTHSPLERKCIFAQNKTTSEKLEFESLRSAARCFDTDRQAIKSRLNTERDLNGWLFKDC